jgi:hypothetical protein
MGESTISVLTAMPFDDVITHFGIKGMKWGVRRKDPSGSSSSTLLADIDAVKAAQTAQMIRSHGLNSVSNKDLQHLIARMNLEASLQQIRDKNNPSVTQRVEAGNKKIRIILGAGKTALEINDLLKKTTGTGLQDLAKKRRP